MFLLGREFLYAGIAFFVCRSCHFVDVLGGRHEVDVGEIAGAAVDPLCRVLLALIDGINQSETRRFALIVFCAGSYFQRLCCNHVISFSFFT